VEQATLRPVPLRPTGPVDPADALRHVSASLPELDELAAKALALVEIAGRTRDAAGDESGLSWAELGDALYRARKALRRSMFPLSASGWCERAERLLSDRIDGRLDPPGPARLDVHLRNCERCVEHERRLSQARDRLVRAFIEAHPESAGAGPAERARPAELRVVEPAVAEPEPQVWTGPTRVVPSFGGPLVEPLVDGHGELAVAAFAGPGGQAPYAPIEPRAPRVEAEPDEDEPPLEREPAEPLIPPDEDRVDARGAGQLIWNGLMVVSVGLAVFALIVTLLAIVGVNHIF
jgi:Putative zinc-finger